MLPFLKSSKTSLFTSTNHPPVVYHTLLFKRMAFVSCVLATSRFDRVAPFWLSVKFFLHSVDDWPLLLHLTNTKNHRSNSQPMNYSVSVVTKCKVTTIEKYRKRKHAHPLLSFYDQNHGL